MDKKISVDEILKSTTDEDINTLQNHEINIESILNEYASSLKDTYSNKLNFNPSLEVRRQSYGGYMHDKELDEILKQADEIYSNQDLNNMNIDDYKSLLQNDLLSKPEEMTIYKRKPNEVENLPYKTPLEFINYMETIFTKNSIESNQNVFILKNYKQHSKLKFSVLDFVKKTILSGRFQKAGNIITSIAAYNNSIFTGNNIGVIKTYSCDQQLEFNSLSAKEIDASEKRAVVCMDISADGELILAGYSNGFIVVWELSTLKVRKLIKDIHKSSIVACKFIRNDSKRSDFITSDIEGNVFKISLKSGYFSIGVESKILIRNPTPIFLIDILKLEEEDKKYFGLEIQKSVIIAFGCLEFVIIYMIEPELKKLIKFEKPKYIKDNSVPDISLGIGFVPNIQETNLVSESIMDATGNQSFWQGQKNVDSTKPQILLSISWGRIIYLYCLPVSNNVIYGFTTAGHYVNLHPIVRMSFLSNSIIFFFDKMKLCRVINTSLITPGEVRLSADNEQPISIVDSLRKPELQEGYLVDPDLKYQTYIIDKVDNTARATFNNHIISFNKNIFVLANRDFYHGKLLNWEQCLNNLNSNSEWYSALSLGLDIYNGRETALADIPQDEKKRKARVGNTLRTLIHQYAIMHMNNDSKLYNKEQDPKQWLSNCINTCIEFCIEIESLEFLLTHLQPIFHSEGYEDEFIQRLEPFIVCDKIKNQQLQQLTIHKIIDFYIKNNKFHTLSQILIHLDIQSIDVDYIKHICNQYNLITPLIYVYTNNEDEDFFYPVKKIFEIFEKAKEIRNFTSYAEAVKNLPIEDLENSKQYIGHKLMWYINLCIQGKKIHNAPIQESKHKKLIIKIIAWILLDEVLPKLLVFDSNSLFNILFKYFEDEKFINILSNEHGDNISNINNKIMDLRPITIIDIIVSKCKEIDSPNRNIILQDLYEYIGKVSVHIPSICKSLIIESIKYLLSHTGNENNVNIANNYSKYIENINNIIIEMIDARKDLDKKDYYFLLEASECSPYVLVKIHLLKLYKNYKRCLEVFLQSDIRLQDKEKKVFEWIDLTFRELKDEDDDNFNSLKQEVLNKLPLLADISIQNVTSLVENWYENEQDLVIEKLDKAEDLQLKYVENVIEKIKDDVEYTGEYDRKYDQFLKILNLHIKLLCKLNPSQVLPNLKKRNSYPIDECLNRCMEYKVYDAAIHLMQNTGAFKDALSLAVDTLKEAFDKIMENIHSSNFNENLHNKKIEEIKNNIKQAIQICENNVSKNEASDDNQEMWFMILEQLYNMIEITKEKTNSKFRMYLDDLSKKLSSELKDVLEKMCSYVSIEAIIKNVTEKYKQAEFKEFKKLLLNMLSSYSHLKNILISAKNLLSNSVLYNVIELKKLNQKGNKYNFNKCDQCSKGFNPMSEEPIIVFGCGHKCHNKCVNSNEIDPFCITCRKNEIENSLFTMGKKSLIQRDLSLRDSLNDSIIENITENVKKGRNENLICRLKAFDKHYLEKSSLNIEKVWIAEQKQREVERKIIENKKKLKEERQIEELKKLQIDAGLIPASHMQRLDWLYQGPECNKDITTAEEFLIGKPLNDKPEEKKYFTPVFQESYSNPQNEIFTKIHEDPVFLMKKEELRQRKELEDNPYKMKMLLKQIEQEVLDKLNKKDKKSKKNKKEKKNKKDKKHKRESDRSTDRDSSIKSYESKNKKEKKSSKRRSCSSSRERSSSSDSYAKKQKSRKNRDYDDKMNLSLNESERSNSKVNQYKMDLIKNDSLNKNNFGLVNSKGDKVYSNKDKNLGPDENLYRNRMEILEKEAELRKKRNHLNVKKLSDEEKEKLRLEMENRAKDYDSIKEEKHLERMSELKDKEDKINKNHTDRSHRKNYDEKPKFLRNFEDQAYNKMDLNLEDSIKRSRYNKQK